MVLSDRAKALISAQRERYLEALPQRRDKIDSLWTRLVQSAIDAPGDSRQNFREFKRLIHKIGGSAGNYDLQELSEEARALEDQLRACGTAGILVAEIEYQRLVQRMDTVIENHH